VSITNPLRFRPWRKQDQPVVTCVSAGFGVLGTLQARGARAVSTPSRGNCRGGHRCLLQRSVDSRTGWAIGVARSAGASPQQRAHSTSSAWKGFKEVCFGVEGDRRRGSRPPSAANSKGFEPALGLWMIWAAGWRTWIAGLCCGFLCCCWTLMLQTTGSGRVPESGEPQLGDRRERPSQRPPAPGQAEQLQLFLERRPKRPHPRRRASAAVRPLG